MLRLPPEAIQDVVNRVYQEADEKAKAENRLAFWNPSDAYVPIADAATLHCLEKVREFLKLWDGATEDSLEFEQNYGVRWDTELVEAFDSWLSHEKGE